MGWLKNILRRKSASYSPLDDWLRGDYAGDYAGSPASQLRQATVWACVKLLADTQASLPLHVYQRSESGVVGRVRQHPAVKVLASPNSWQQPADFAGNLATLMALYGNFFCLVTRDGERPLELLPYRPGEVAPYQDLTTLAVTYRGPRGELPLSDLIHVRGLSIDNLNGLSAPAHCGVTVGTALASSDHLSRTLRSGGRPSGVISFPTTPAADAIERVRQDWNSGSNAGKTHLLYGGAQYSAINQTNEQMRLPELVDQASLDICSFFGVPPGLVGRAAGNVSLSEQRQQFAQQTVLPLCVKIEQQYNARLLSPRDRAAGLYVKHNLEGLQRADLAARTAYYVGARTGGWLTSNEIRALESLPPIDGGDDLQQPLNSSTTNKGGDSA